MKNTMTTTCSGKKAAARRAHLQSKCTEIATAQSAYAQSTQPQTGVGTIKKKIGNTIYRVSVHFSDTSKERIEDKILRMVSNDVSGLSNIATNKTKNRLKNDIDCGILDLPQTGRLLEGGSFS